MGDIGDVEMCVDWAGKEGRKEWVVVGDAGGSES